MRTGVFPNKLFINHTTFFQTNKDKSYRRREKKKRTEPFAYKTVSQNLSVCNIRGRDGVVVVFVVVAFSSHTLQLTDTSAPAHMYTYIRMRMK